MVGKGAAEDQLIVGRDGFGGGGLGDGQRAGVHSAELGVAGIGCAQAVLSAVLERSVDRRNAPSCSILPALTQCACASREERADVERACHCVSSSQDEMKPTPRIILCPFVLYNAGVQEGTANGK